MKENVKVEESIRVVIRDKRTGKIIRDEYLGARKGFLERILGKILGRDDHNTVLAKGWENIVRLLGNVGTGYPINQIYSNIGATVSTENTVIVGSDSGATLRVSNSLHPWDTAGHYTWVKTRNSSSGDIFNSIKVDVYISSGQEWWVEEEWRFSQS